MHFVIMTQRVTLSPCIDDNQAAISLDPRKMRSSRSLSKFLEHLPPKFCKQTKNSVVFGPSHLGSLRLTFRSQLNKYYLTWKRFSASQILGFRRMGRLGEGDLTTLRIKSFREKSRTFITLNLRHEL